MPQQRRFMTTRFPFLSGQVRSASGSIQGRRISLSSRQIRCKKRRFLRVPLRVPQDSPKRAPRWAQEGPKMAPRLPQDGPKMAQDAPKTAPGQAKMAPRRPKIAPRSKKTAAGWPSVAPRWPTMAPRRPQAVPEQAKIELKGFWTASPPILRLSAALPVPCPDRFLSVAGRFAAKNDVF